MWSKSSRAPEEYPKDSLDRFGDDLCGLVLSYLSLEDCFRLECLSKQWRRSIHQKRHKLVVGVDSWVPEVIPLTDDYRDVERMDSQTFDAMVKKLPNITSIYITILSEATERVFEVLMKSYKHLKTIHVRFWTGNDTQLVDRLLRTYGSQLTSIVMTRDAFNVYKEHSLKTLHISIQFMNTEVYIAAMKLLCELKALRELTLRIHMIGMIEDLIPVIDYHCDEFVNQWPQLKRYQLTIMYATIPQMRRVIESLNDLKRLQYLTLNFSDLAITQSFFDDIDTHLPRLKAFRLVAKLDINACITATVERLPKLTNMSSNGKNGTQEEYLKNSFDRFGDDLCEVLLSYLPFEASIRLECVSKQWRRSIHQKRDKLVINAVIPELGHLKNDYIDVEGIDIQKVESLVKKLPNITRIEITVKSEAPERVFESVNGMRGLRRLRLIFIPLLRTYNNMDLSLNSLSALKRLQHLWIDFDDLVVNERFFDDIDTHLPRLQSLRLSAYFEMSAGIKESVERLPKLIKYDFHILKVNEQCSFVDSYYN
ncbi:unnamed protein product, partial [Oppiella nova]